MSMISEEERAERLAMIRESAAAIVPPDGNVMRPRALRFGDHDFDRATWTEMAGLGWQALLVGEEQGGIGLGMGELCALAEMLGRGLAPEPLVATAAAADLLQGDDRDAVLGGESVLLVVQAPADIVDGRFSGTVRGVLAARDADLLLIASGDKGWIVPLKGDGVTMTCAQTQDGGTIADVTFDAVAATPVDGDVARAVERYTLGTAAYLLGVADRAFSITLDHLRTRKQFGVAVGSFQALQHRCADLLVQLELMRASIDGAAKAMDNGTAAAALAVSRAKTRSSDAAMLITRDAIQLHGGIGYADESDVGLYLRKAMALMNQAGSPSAHRKRYAAGLLAA